MSRQFESATAGMLAALVSTCLAACLAACGGNGAGTPVPPLAAASLGMVAGGLGGPGDMDGTAGRSRLLSPRRIAADAAGRLTVNDACGYRRVGTDGVLATLAGEVSGATCSLGEAGTARALVARADGSVVFTSASGSAVYQMGAGGGVSRLYDFAGGGALRLGGIALARDGAVLVHRRDAGAAVCRVDRLTFTGGAVAVALLAGGIDCGSADGPRGSGQVTAAMQTHLAVDSTGTTWLLSDDDASLRRIAPDGTLSTVATPLVRAAGLAVDAQDTVYVAGWSDPAVLTGAGAASAGLGAQVWRLRPTGGLEVMAGQQTAGPPADGDAGAARLVAPGDLAVDPAGALWLTDPNNGLLRRIDAAGNVTTPQGKLPFVGHVDATGIAARFDRPRAIATDATGNAFLADTGNCVIRKVTPAGAVTTLAGRAGTCAVADGAAGTASLGAVSAIALEAAGSLLVGDTCTVRRVKIDGSILTLAGSPALCIDRDGTGPGARFGRVAALAIDAGGNVLIGEGPLTDAAASGQPGCGAPDGRCAIGAVIRRMTPGAVVTTWAGVPGRAGQADGPRLAATFAGTDGLALDARGNLYVADALNHAVRRITPDGTVSTFAGSAAAWQAPTLLALAPDGRLLVGDTGLDATGRLVAPQSVRSLSPDGSALTLFRNAAFPQFGVTLGPTPGLNIDAGGIAATPDGGVLLTTENSILRWGPPR